ncbi:hypothetical protein VTI74DRAFT_6539 [Chaetomium olivicolor]
MPTNNHNTPSGLANDVANDPANLAVIFPVLYLLIALAFGISNIQHRHTLLPSAAHISWWDIFVLFILGWAWPAASTFACSQITKERVEIRERRRELRGRRREMEVPRSLEWKEEKDRTIRTVVVGHQ